MQRILLSLFCFLLLTLSAQAQSVQGVVLDRDSLPLAGATIQNIRTKLITITDNNGAYTITANSEDTILFRAIGYHPLALRADIVPGVIYLHAQIVELQGVEIVKRSYRADSLALRDEYRKAFDFRRPKFTEMVKVVPMGVAFDIYKVYQGLSFRKNKKKEIFQSRLINYEHEKYIDQVFTTTLVSQYSGLAGDSLQQFMKAYRPDYAAVQSMAAYDLLVYIKQSVAKYRATPAPSNTP